MIENGRILQNRYLIERQIGAGGMGAVHLGIDQRFGSTVAIKETISADARSGQASEREALILNSLRHPALPHVIDYFIEGDGQFIVMEYIAGEDLFEIIEKQHAFEVSDVLRWADDLLDALNYLHTQRLPIVHRDIKPQNLKLTPRGEIFLLDFGLAKGNPTELSQMTMTKSIFGYSRCYAPLEQIQGTGTDPRSDLYSLAATLYHLLTGHPPVDALTRATAVLSNNADPLVPLHSLNSQVPAAVSQILHQALSLNANVRPAAAAEMRSALRAAASQMKSLTAVEVSPESTAHAAELTPQTENPPENDLSFKAKKQTFVLGKSANTNPIAGKGLASKFITKAKTSGVKTTKLFVEPKNLWHSVTAVRIAAASLLLCGLLFAVFSGNFAASSEAVDANAVQAENLVQPTAKTSETVIPAQKAASDVDLPIAISPPAENVAAEPNPTKTAETLSVQPVTDSGRQVKTNVAKKKLVTPAQSPVRGNLERVDDNKEESLVAGRQELEKNSAVKIVNINNNRKSGGFKGFLNKIGSGAINIPKSIFKKKKDR